MKKIPKLLRAGRREASHLAFGGGKSVEKVSEALASVPEYVEEKTE
jgi:hypothetical protein